MDAEALAQRLVSPGLTSRPSLSGAGARVARAGGLRVAGINLPAFVERSRSTARARTRSAGVAGVNSRPSLSGPVAARLRIGGGGVAGVNSRPSLSVRSHEVPRRNAACVAGVNSRPSLSDQRGRRWFEGDAGVAGVPAFVERPGGRTTPRRANGVSPGLTSRPSLSDGRRLHHRSEPGACRRG